MPYIGALRACGLAKETTVGTLVTPPTRFLPYIPPDGFNIAYDLIESQGIRTLPDQIYKVQQGLGTIKGAKLKLEVEPENCGEILMALMGVDTPVLSASTAYTHTFTRLGAAQLPTYSFWFDRGPKFSQYTGCMLSKVDFSIKPKGFLEADTDWEALKYDDTGSSQSPSYSPRKPFTFNQAVVKLDGSQINNYSEIKITVDNMVATTPTLNATQFASKIYSAGLKCTVQAKLVFEDTTQYTKYLAGTSAAFNVAFTSAETIAGSTGNVPYSLTFDIPTMNYKSAPIANPKGLMEVTFDGVAVYTVGSTKTLSVALVNSISASY
jgi:hypothetical protein